MAEEGWTALQKCWAAHIVSCHRLSWHDGASFRIRSRDTSMPNSLWCVINLSVHSIHCIADSRLEEELGHSHKPGREKQFKSPCDQGKVPKAGRGSFWALAETPSFAPSFQPPCAPDWRISVWLIGLLLMAAVCNDCCCRCGSRCSSDGMSISIQIIRAAEQWCTLLMKYGIAAGRK